MEKIVGQQRSGSGYWRASALWKSKLGHTRGPIRVISLFGVVAASLAETMLAHGI